MPEDTSRTARPPLQFDDLVYRRGFLIRGPGVDVPDRAGWRAFETGEWRLSAHPDAVVRSIPTGDGPPALAIGEAYDATHATFDSAATFARLVGLLRDGGEAAFLDGLDTIAGRFALLVRVGGDWRVYHDAMGTRAVFHHLDLPLVASHPGLVAEPLRLAPPDWFLQFVTSSAFVKRDVKYLPGMSTTYDEMRQLPANCYLDLSTLRPRRYWPREDLPQGSADVAIGHFIREMRGLHDHLAHRDATPYVGLTGGLDSRGIIAALAPLDPVTFTYQYTPTGRPGRSDDMKGGARIAEALRLTHERWGIKAPITIDEASDDLSRAFRVSTGWYRGGRASWQHHLLGRDLPSAVFIRGSGGEILRGFYQNARHKIGAPDVKSLSRAYGVNTGAPITRERIGEYIEWTDLASLAGRGYDVNDIFYWEHRMSAWGAINLGEADLVIPAMAGYNCRALFASYMALDLENRLSKAPIRAAIARIDPRIEALPYS